MDVLTHDKNTGLFHWLEPTSNYHKPGDIAGSVHNRKCYRSISIDYGHYFAHRLVWLYYHGRWPINRIDHINHNKDDNRLENLREATLAQNAQNQVKAQCDNATGLLGVTKYNKPMPKPYMARIQVDGRRVHLGLFITGEEAYEAYLVAKRKYHTHNTL